MYAGRSKSGALISSIYDAAVDGRAWDEALVTLAEVTGCSMAALEVFERGTVQLIGGCNPFVEEGYLQSFIGHWRHQPSHRRVTESFALGEVFGPDHAVDWEALQKSPFFNEWLDPQGFVGCGRFSNIELGSRATAVLSAVKPAGADFSDSDHRLFATAADHFARATGIHRRLRLADAQQSVATAGAAPAGFVIVDRAGRLLASHDATQSRLDSAGLMRSRGNVGRLDTDNPALARLISDAATSRNGTQKQGGCIDYRGDDGALLRITVLPLAEVSSPDGPWRLVDRPAALLHVHTPEDAARERVDGLAAEYGLTPAEAQVAIETARGDGRAAVAARLGIRETTVRSHLSAIFDKLGIHRQAELTRVVSSR